MLTLPEIFNIIERGDSFALVPHGGFGLSSLPGGRLFPAWNSVDRELEPNKALDPADVRITDTTEIGSIS